MKILAGRRIIQRFPCVRQNTLRHSPLEILAVGEMPSQAIILTQQEPRGFAFDTLEIFGREEVLHRIDSEFS